MEKENNGCRVLLLTCCRLFQAATYFIPGFLQMFFYSLNLNPEVEAVLKRYHEIGYFDITRIKLPGHLINKKVRSICQCYKVSRKQKYFILRFGSTWS